MSYAHQPVMLREVLEILAPKPARRYLDATVGGGGHAGEILRLSSPDGTLLGLDCDDQAIAAAGRALDRFGERVTLRRSGFDRAREVLDEVGWPGVDGLLLDLGLSSHQLDTPERGFGFQSDARLDMRMDRRRPVDAHELVNSLPVVELERIIRDFGEEPRARRIASAIDARRREEAIDSTRQLAETVARAMGGSLRRARKAGRPATHPATRTFQAVRIAVNRELESLETFLESAYELLCAKGRLVIISFHSLEDRLVKRAFRRWGLDCVCPPRVPACVCGWARKATAITKRPRVPSEEEVRVNPRARSARLRAVERV
ncbi:MAG: 16S rRNA (cytosine(1402)-N(4))-methyltransferase RsmH [Deltaproteobacteria bacterium]|nr:16S rRNA (cytosine(1402)-N(4))-methyltransferase RsmH [Deltaproteobacteria bacterium]